MHVAKAGIVSFTIFERASEIGGTWRDNTYPGAACDVPSQVYSFSFEAKADWSSRFAGSAEIQDYLLRCVDKYKLRQHLRLNTTIADATFDERLGIWTLTTDDGEQFLARAVVSAMRGLVDPSYPDIKGIESFEGQKIHTARWNHDYDLARWTQFLLSEAMGPMIMLDSPRLSRVAEKMCEKHLERSVHSPALREKLRPDFQFGCKRILISDDYLSTFERDNVGLVTEGISEIRAHGILTDDGIEHELDAIIFATGFDVAITTPRIPIKGVDGKSLAEAWHDGAEAYKGVSVSGFPNWFIIMGPNTGPGHTSVLIFSEAQIGYIVQGIKKLVAENIRCLSVKGPRKNNYPDFAPRFGVDSAGPEGAKPQA